MKDYEYEEENLDDFMVNAASTLCEEDNPEKKTIIESLKQHLSSIFHIQNEMENFFKTLNGVIFTSKPSKKNTQKIDNKEPFILYPIIFSFNPKTTSYFLDYYLNSLQRSICEDNRGDFSFISEVFADVVLAFFSDDKYNKYLIKKGFLLEQNKKKNIYEKLLNFCNTNIKTNKKLEQSFGCLLLTEFIEKCPMVKDDKNLDALFKIVSEYLDDRWFECKIDLLNCTISLIFAAEEKFKPYATICIFRVLDYLTDTDWMKRKLAVNIVYTLVFYCKDEIMAVKDNIFEFLNVLKEDSVDEVREVCLHTLKFLGEEEEDNMDDELNVENEKNKPKNVYNKYKTKGNQKNKLNRSYDTGDNMDSQTAKSAKSQKNKNNFNTLNRSDEHLKVKGPNTLDVNKKNNYNYSSFNNSNKSKNTNNYNSNTRSKQNIKKVTPFDNSAQEAINTTINTILDQIKKIKETQSEFRDLLTNLKQSAGNNYLNLNERLRALEKQSAKLNRNTGYDRYNNYNYNHSEGNSIPRSQKDFRREKKTRPITLNKSEEKLKIAQLKNLFNEGRYNEALLETNQNDRYLLKILPLYDRTIIPKLEIAILEDVISRLNKRIPILCMEEAKDNINDVLTFFIQLLKSKINLKLVTQLNIKNALTFLKSKGNYILTQEDINTIDRIISSLKVQK